MAKVGRNDPCPCGSGRKFKKCCYRRSSPKSETPAPSAWVAEVTELDDLSNSALDLIQQGRLEEAEKLCRKLQDRYPDQVDALERYAQLYEARGDWKQAADSYRQAAEFARRSSGFDDATIADWLEHAEHAEARGR